MAGIRMSGIASGFDTDALVTQLMAAEKTKVDTIERKKALLELKKETWKEVNKDILSFYNGSLNKLQMQGTFMEKDVTSNNTSVATATGTIASDNGRHEFNITQLAKGSVLSSDKIMVPSEVEGEGDVVASANTKLSDLGFDFSGGEVVLKLKGDSTKEAVAITLTEEDTLATFAKKISDSEAGVSARYESNYGRLMLSTQDTGANQQISMSFEDSEGNAVDMSTGLDRIQLATTGSQGQNAKFDYNGAVDLESASNDIQIAGMTISAFSTGSVTVNVKSNVDEAYKAVKEFVTDFNKVLKNLNDRAYSGKLKGYDALTKEESKAMSEDERKLWNDTLKTSLLNRDESAIEVIDAMRAVTTANQGVDTSKLTEGYTSLSEIGIATGDWKEKGLLHIAGDIDDIVGISQDDKLRKALEENPEAVMNLLNEVGKALTTELSEKMSKTETSSALTFYNDKQIDKDIDAYATKMSEMEARMTMLEERYYKQFTAMETAMAKAQSTSSWLAGMFGTSAVGAS